MEALQIDAEKLKTVRKARKIGRPKLGKLTGLTERQIARLEVTGATHGAISDETVERIAAALHVPPGVITGALPLTDDDLVPVTASTCKSGCCG
ncbi:helix-turn-helix domain-containing protein [Amaricoccus macauensis]|uniref:helix-turn-helix domain-containing protein n=1 Tax=Amaricoccus macauensis TaxID=57001 RepID=UPI003C7E43FD